MTMHLLRSAASHSLRCPSKYFTILRGAALHTIAFPSALPCTPYGKEGGEQLNRRIGPQCAHAPLPGLELQGAVPPLLFEIT